MKKITLILMILGFGLTRAQSQVCSRLVSSFNAAQGGFAINGTAMLVNSNGSTTLTFDNAFSTTSGPDLHVYLAASFAAPTVAGNTHVDIGPLQSFSGQQSYNIPSGIQLSDYDYILIHCNTFNHFWGGGLMGGINCITGVNDLPPTSEITVTSIPGSGLVNFSNIPQGTELSVFNLIGNQVFRTENLLPVQSDFSFLEKGIYVFMFTQKSIGNYAQKVLIE